MYINVSGIVPSPLDCDYDTKCAVNVKPCEFFHSGIKYILFKSILTNMTSRLLEHNKKNFFIYMCRGL